MNINLLCTLLIVLICRDGPLASGSPVTSDSVATLNDIKALDDLSGNHYFQATKQIFYLNAQIQIPNNTQSEKPKPPPSVPAGYVITPGIGAHKFYSTPKAWNDARNTCIQEGAHLTILRSANEEDIVKKLQLEKNIWQTWLGVHEQFKDDDWVTVFDEPLNGVGFAPWNKGEPNHLAKKEHCVGYIKEPHGTGLNDNDCNQALPFFCKIDL